MATEVSPAMQRREVTVDDVVELLNEMVELDQVCITKLVERRIPCNERVGEHPSIQVAGSVGGATVGLVGVLNGLFGTDEQNYGAIQYTIDDDIGLVRFDVREPFQEKSTPKPPPSDVQALRAAHPAEAMLADHLGPKAMDHLRSIESETGVTLPASIRASVVEHLAMIAAEAGCEAAGIPIEQ